MTSPSAARTLGIILLAAGALLAPSGCSSHGDATRAVDAGRDVKPIIPPPPEPCDLSQDFGAPALVLGLPVGNAWASAGTLTADEMMLAYDNGNDLVIASRNEIGSFETKPWLDAVNSPSADYLPWINGDGRELFFISNRNGGAFDLYRARRDDPQSAFTAAQNILHLATGSVTFPYLREGRELWFTPDNGDGAQAIFRAIITGDGTFGPAMPVGELNEPSSRNARATLTPDGLTVYFASNRNGSQQDDVWVATRTSETATFAPPKRLASVNSPFIDVPSWVSPDGCRLYVSSNRPEGNEPGDASARQPHMFVAQRRP